MFLYLDIKMKTRFNLNFFFQSFIKVESSKSSKDTKQPNVPEAFKGPVSQI